MNTITHNGQSHDFSTLAELGALADAITGAHITHLYRDGLTLVGYDSQPVMCVIGTTKEPVLFLGKSPASQPGKP